MKNIALSAVAAAMLLTVCNTTAADVPSASFGQIPAIEKPALSPDGRYVAAVLNTGEFPAVAVAEFGSTELTTILRLEHKRDRIRSIVWTSTDRLIVTVVSAKKLRGRPYELQEMHAIDKDGKNLKHLIWKVASRYDTWSRMSHVIEGSATRYSRETDGQGRILALLPYDPNHILVELFETRGKSLYAYKLNIFNNDSEKLLVGQKDSRRWVMDSNDELALSFVFDYYRKSVVHEYRDFWSGDWIEYRADPYLASETFTPLLVSDGRAIVMSNHEFGVQSLWLYDFEKQQFAERIFGSDKYDLLGVIWDFDQQHIIGVEYIDDRLRQVYFDAKNAARLQAASSIMPDHDVTISSMSRDASRIIIRASRSDSPPKYLWVDFDKQAAGAWFSEYPNLESVTLHETATISFTASDGTEIGGYLTLPALHDDALPPLVVYAHDGPQERFANQFDPMVQLLANLGMAVLQINHRGSSGFGVDFAEAGYRQWGTRMQQDIYDGIDWLAKRKSVATERACILGHGYGGFVALTAAYPTVQRFQCAISVNGITDLRKHLLDAEFYGYTWHRNILSLGDPEDKDAAVNLDRLSPVTFADRIRIPVLLIHSEFNKQVFLDQFSDLRLSVGWSELGGPGNKRPFEFIELDMGTHAIDGKQNRLATFRAVDDFLGKYLN